MQNKIHVYIGFVGSSLYSIPYVLLIGFVGITGLPESSPGTGFLGLFIVVLGSMLPDVL